jgi:hypothetical protein
MLKTTMTGNTLGSLKIPMSPVTLMVADERRREEEVQDTPGPWIDLFVTAVMCFRLRMWPVI